MITDKDPTLPATRCRALAAGMLLGLATSQAAFADSLFDATPDDNLAIAAAHGALMGAHLGGVAGGLAVQTFAGTGFEMAAVAADVALKQKPPLLELPDDFTRLPNAASSVDGNPFNCVYRFQRTIRKDQDIRGDGYADGIEEAFGGVYFVPYDPLDDVFADMGKPAVYHPQADIRVRVRNQYLDDDAWPNIDPGLATQLLERPEFPAGRHELRWEAHTTTNIILDFTLPSSLIPIGIASEAYLSKRVGLSAGKAGFVSKAVGLAAAAGLIAENVTDATAKQKWYEDTLLTTAANRGTQVLTVWDTALPYFRDTQTGATHVTEQDIVLEATDFGGVRFGRERQRLRDRFEPDDDCGESFTVTTDSPTSRLLTIDDGPHELVWEAREVDGGPYDPNVPLSAIHEFEGESVVTRFVQRISVVDTQAPLLLPPEGFARETTSDLDLTAEPFPLGRPRVADLADPSPVVSNDAPATLAAGPEGRRYEIIWQARDATGNATVAPPGEPDKYKQIVTLKPPGTNTAPTAAPASASTIASAGVEIQLTGNDTDLIDGRYDPLKFEIAAYPAAGQFVAPLFPYFIDDFRLTPAGEREEGDNLTRTSPLKHLANDFRLADPLDRGIFLNDMICNAEPGSLEDQEFGGVIPVDFVYMPQHVHVDDENNYYIRDHFWVCGEGENDNIYLLPMAEPVLSKLPRLSKWSDAGELLAMAPLYPTESGDYDDTNLDPTFWPEDRFNVQEDGRVWISIDNDAWTTNGAQDFRDHLSFDTDLGDMRSHGRISYSITEHAYLIGSDTDPRYDVIYELYPLRIPRNNIRYRFDVLKVSRYVENGEVGDPATLIGFYDFRFPQMDRLASTDIKVDSEGYVYISDDYHRIHKIAPITIDASGEWRLGEYIGWMGRCSANKLDDDGVPYSACDEDNEVSYGYACDWGKCVGDYDDPAFFLNIALRGEAPGQFDSPKSIAIGPRDVLYVADSGNSRVQRFGPDGTFAGEAKSTGTGVNQGEEGAFIIGNMGMPEQVTVNAHSFYVMEKDDANGDYFVHVFKTSPFYDLTDNSAKVEYVSHFDFLPQDGFSYTVDDGIARSAPAPVSVSVSRAFRPPERLLAQCFDDSALVIDVPCELPEDGELYVRLSAYDPDGFVSTGGYDSLDFELLEAPAHGELTQVAATDNAAVYRYVPSPDYNGGDSLRFRATDGNAHSAENAAVAFTVTPMPDPVVVEFDGELRAARGFPSVVSADFSDVDEDPGLQGSLVSIDWGDGVAASNATWQNSGREDLNGREVNPQLDFGRGTGMLIGSHNYDGTGSYDISVVMDNAPEENLPPTTVTATIEVLDVTVVGASLASPDDAVNPDQPFVIVVDVTNFEPTNWAGLEADNVVFAFDVPAGLGVLPTDPRCAGTVRISCELGTLVQGETTSVSFGGLIGLDAARESGLYTLVLELSDAGPKLEDRNTAALNITISDRDGDGTIDVDDAFVDDPRYSTDSDGDGLADAWERDHGLDPDVADDSLADSDGDGYTLLDEFENGSFPGLAEHEQVEPGNRLESPDNVLEDRFGLAIAGGDLNGDGYADVVIGASTYDTSGAVFIAWGGSDGANPTLRTLRPTAGETAMGRSVAVGDWDDNGYPDLAVAANATVAVHDNNGEILEVPDRWLDAAAAGGRSLASGDIDGDGVDDLIVDSDPGDGTTRIDIYGSATGGLDAAPQTLVVPGGGFAALALGDLDGDGAPDLVLGRPGLVRGYLGADNSWLAVDGLTVSFELGGAQSNFGHRIATGADVTGDGIDDLVVGAYGGAGAILLYDSASGYWSNNGAAALQVIAGLDDGSGAGDTHGDQFGVSLALGHLDSDPYADLAVGANRAGLADEGQVQILRGSPAGFRVNPQRIDGTTTYDLLGHNVAIPGDVDGDGFDDVAGGASDVFTAQNPSPDGGYVQLLYHAFVATDPSDDPDGDGVRAAIDNCPADANTNQSDIDADGAGDACDNDIDGDGFVNDLDNCPRHASLDQTDTDGDLDGDVCDGDDDGDGVADDDDAFPLNAMYSTDSDDDGMPDEWETENGLDANDGADALGDLDGDGRNNLAEFEGGFDVTADDVAPQLSAPAAIVVDSIGPLTPVRLGTATATDARDGAITPVADRQGPFAPGRTLVTWTATDAAGNTVTAGQPVDVIPQVGFVGDTLVAAEGMQATLLVALNGDAVTYPVTVPYTVSGAATQGSDYTLATGDIVIDNANVAALGLQVLADAVAEGDEQAIITLGAPANAINGNVQSFQVIIREGNLPPLPRLSIEQDGRRVTTVVQDGPAVQVSVDASDPNASDSHAYDWSASDDALLPQEGFGLATFTFDPAAVAAGVYRVAVEVTDDGLPASSSMQYRYVRVIATAPDLVAGDDSDGDGISDGDEELRDSNDNGASDYLDPASASHHVVSRSGGNALLQAQDGYTLTLGRVALTTGDDAMVSMTDVTAGGVPDDERFGYPAGIFDFEVHGLPRAGHTVTIVIPQSAPVPADAVYRKFIDGQGWADFTAGAGDTISSAAGEPGVCPAPGSSDYTSGLTAGDHCVQLTIVDGGPNDADGSANRVVRDPGGVAVVAQAAAVGATSMSVPDTAVRTGDSNVVMLRFRLDSNSSDVVLNELTLNAAGSGDDGADIRAVKAWIDGNANGVIDGGDTEIGSGSYDADDGELRLQMATPQRLDAGATDILISYDF